MQNLLKTYTNQPSKHIESTAFFANYEFSKSYLYIPRIEFIVPINICKRLIFEIIQVFLQPTTVSNL